MKKFFLKHKKVLMPLILILLTLPTFWALLRPGFFFMQDDLQAFRIYEMDKCFQDHQIPCRWVPDPGYQYGYPQFEYYPPSVYYLGELIHLLGFQFIDSVKVLFILGYVLSALGMYFFLREFLGEEIIALTGAVLYTITPYKAVDVYVRGAMSEFWSFVFFPLIFWMILRLVRTGKNRYIALSALSIGGLLLTHNLMSFIFLPIAGVWSVLLVWVEKKWKLLFKLLIAALLGLGLAAFFTLPVLTEQKDAHLETLLGGYFGFEQHFVDLNQLFISNHWGYGSSQLGPNDDLSLSTGIIQWMAAAVALVLGLLTFKKFKKESIIIFGLGLSEIVVLFMMHPKSIVIWNKIPPMAFLQFPWRFLTDSVFLLAVILSVGIFIIHKLNLRFKKIQLSVIYCVVLMVSVFALHISFFQPMNWLNISDKDKFSGVLWEKELTISIFDYLPIGARLPPIHKAPPVPEILDGSGTFLSYFKGSDYQTGEVNITKPSEIRLPLFDFPGMKVWVDGKEVPHFDTDCRYQDFCLGLISFNLGAGNHIIKAQLTNTPIRTFGNSVTILSLVIVGGLLLFHKKNEKNPS